jgi:hypothetical protein
MKEFPMKVKVTNTDADYLVTAFNGELAGLVLEADDVEGYIIKQVAGPEIDFLEGPHFPCPIQEVRLEGKVAFIGNSLVDSRETILANLNKHRSDCGLPPHEVLA